VFLLATISCARVTTIPPSQYREHEPGLSYRVKTMAGQSYRVSRFSVTDSSLVILSFRKLDEDEKFPATPFEVSIDSVRSVEMIEPTIWAPLGLAAVATIIIAIATADLGFN
jgi:hypothetical protein